MGHKFVITSRLQFKWRWIERKWSLVCQRYEICKATKIFATSSVNNQPDVAETYEIHGQTEQHCFLINVMCHLSCVIQNQYSIEVCSMKVFFSLLLKAYLFCQTSFQEDRCLPVLLPFTLFSSIILRQEKRLQPVIYIRSETYHIDYSSIGRESDKMASCFLKTL